MNRLVLFDCDETLWTSPNQDYISRVTSPLALRGLAIIRVADDQMFTLRPGIKQLLRKLHTGGWVIGIVSDNQPNMVLEALTLLGLSPYIEPQAVHIKLWDGPCPKQLMVKEILDRPSFAHLIASDVWWIDDKDYVAAALDIGVNFVQVNSATTAKELGRLIQ
jgi:magnesium-dependent phosphatase-1